VAVVVLAAGGGLAAIGKGMSTDIPVRYPDPVERYKYGSIGAEYNGVPKFVWQALPEVCGLEGGYESVGWVFEKGRELPIGMSERNVGGVSRVGFNCAACHTGTVREAPDKPARVVPGMPPVRIDLQKYGRFLFGCVMGDKFTPDAVMAVIEKKHDLSVTEKLLYRHWVVPKTREVTKIVMDQNDWYGGRPDFGPGRFDAINVIRQMLAMPPKHDRKVSQVDYPSIWNQQARKKHLGQWDGSSYSMVERNRLAAWLAAADPDALDLEELKWLDEWLLTLPAPAYPFPVDGERRAKGKELFQQHCARCHSHEPGSKAGQVIPLAELGVDRNRSEMLDAKVAKAIDGVTHESWKIRTFKVSGGYAAQLLDGIWARAPYLHNGSVPTLRDLLEPAEKRPKLFYRGYDVYDPVRGGFVTSGAEAEKHGFRFDTRLPGNGNQGHLYGTDLSSEDKDALVEFVKSNDFGTRIAASGY
jgi:mono/diheme cytochrome c family protein